MEDKNISDILRMPDYCASDFSETAANGGTHHPEPDESLWGEPFIYCLKYEKDGREVRVSISRRDNGTTAVFLKESNYSLLPRKGSRWAVSAKLSRGKPIIDFHWKPWVLERTISVHVKSAENIEEIVDVACESAIFIEEEYSKSYMEKMKYAPLEDMILSAQIRIRR